MAGSSKLTKAAFIAALADGTGLDKKSVNNVLEALATLVKKELGNGGPGEVTIPNLVKLKATKKAAVPERDGIHPFTKQPMKMPAKPASMKVRAAPVKALKDSLTGG
jgi:nucleoid DNA-binding protein